MLCSPALAGGVDFNYESFYLDRDAGRAKIILKIRNDTASPLKMVIAECAFLNGDKRAVDTATLITSNVEAGQSAYADGWSAQVGGIEHAECRISSAR